MGAAKEAHLDHKTVRTVIPLLGDYPELTPSRLRELAETDGNGRRRSRVEPLRARDIAKIMVLLVRKVTTRAAARQLMRLR
jgi:hypothetical protein